MKTLQEKQEQKNYRHRVVNDFLRRLTNEPIIEKPKRAEVASVEGRRPYMRHGGVRTSEDVRNLLRNENCISRLDVSPGEQ
jgi:hypothetical protein